MNITINATNVTINAAPEGCDIEPRDMLDVPGYEADRDMLGEQRYRELEARTRFRDPRRTYWYDPYLDVANDYSIEPCDMLAPPLTDWPASLAFSVPGRPGDGYAALHGATARLQHNDDVGFYYEISGHTMPSRRLLYAIGCVYSKSRGIWLCMDYAVLAPYAVPGGIAG